MDRTQSKQAGFGIAELILVIVAVGVVGAGGWFVYQHNRTRVTGAAAGTQTTNQTTTVVKIPELGIQITVPAEIKDLTYQVQTLTLKNGTQSPTAYFSTTALTALDANCGAGVNSPLGTLGRGDGQYPSNDPTAAIDYGTLIKQFPTFYITEGFPNGSCSTNASTQGAITKFKSDFQTAVVTVQATY